MIFATVGTQLGFDRLVRALDAWAGADPQREVFAQIGPGEYEPTHMAFAREMTPAAFQEKLAQAELVVAHAGMGTIISALELGKPVLVMPRQAALGEHRNDHQLATAKKLSEAKLVHVVPDEKALAGMLNEFQAEGETRMLSATASQQLLDCVQQFIRGGE